MTQQLIILISLKLNHKIKLVSEGRKNIAISS